jgi:uncharacterized protein YcaQ
MALHAQLLDNKTKLPKSKEAVAQVIEKLGYIQIDTIAAIERAHHHTLWTRFGGYKPEMLHHLQAEDRRIFEYWGHQVSYLPMSDFRFYLPMKKSFYNSDKGWAKMMIEKCRKYLKPVLERVRNEGPLSSKDFETAADHRRGPWWDWKPAKAALEMLFWRGELMIAKRHNFQKVYDLTERALPDFVDTHEPTENELGQFLVHRALNSYGVARENEIRKHIQIGNKEIIAEAIKNLLDSGKITKIKIAGIDTEYYALADRLKNLTNLRKLKSRALIISPFDNLIIQRERLKRLFGFDYALECYTPAAKRKYGYFVLPILFGEQFMGRVDPKVDRKRKTLVINNIYFESKPDNYDQYLTSLAGQFWQMARFNNCEKIEIKKSTPAKFKKELQRQLKNHTP